MDDNLEELVIDVRATTEGFANDLKKMRSALDTNLADGFDRAGSVLERSLIGAIRRGSLGFDDLKQAAFSAFDQIAAEALKSGLGSIFGSGGGLGGVLGGTIGALFGLPGRATGGPVSPGRGYLVGERGPEIFVPTSSGQIAPSAQTAQPAREVRVAIQLGSSANMSAPTALRRSSRQMASAVRRALQEA